MSVSVMLQSNRLSFDLDQVDLEIHQSTLSVRLIRICISVYEDVLFLQKTFLKIPSMDFFENVLLRHHELKKEGQSRTFEEKNVDFRMFKVFGSLDAF